MKFTLRLVGAIWVSALVVIAGFAFLQIREERHRLVNDLERRAHLLGEGLKEAVEPAVARGSAGVIFSFFAPVFFLRAGMQLDLTGINLPTIGITAVLLVVAGGLKYVATALVARWLVPALGHFAGVLFNYRLTFGIITATVGLQEGLLDQRLFSMVVLIILASAALPMVLLRDLPTELDR